MTEVEYRLFWARTYLKNFGAIENSKQKVWALTAKGTKMLKENIIDAKTTGQTLCASCSFLASTLSGCVKKQCFGLENYLLNIK